MKRLLGRGRQASPSDMLAEQRLAAERAHVLVEESRESVVVLDADSRVLAASRSAREALQGLVEGAPFPKELFAARAGQTPLRISYEVGGRPETLIYLSAPGDLAAYEELRAGFTAAVSHELRTPLARLMVLLDSVSLPGANTAELVEQARAEVEQMGDLIDDVLFLSELESGRVVVSLGSTRVLPVLEEAAAVLADRAETAGVRVAIDCPTSFDLPLRQRMVRVVAENLMGNAIHYAGDGATCTVACRRDGDRLLLIVTDDGAGVPEQDLSRLFERFYRADRARSTRGTGLGLAIVKHVVAAGGGSVEATATPDGGLTVTCSFPVRSKL